VIFRGTMLGVPICEDIWHPNVCRHLADFGAEIFCAPMAAPMRSTRTRCASTAWPSAAPRPRGCRWPISTAWAGRTNWCSTAPALW
jgi:predicted amidohydrolase